MTDSREAVLSTAEVSAAEAILRMAWGSQVSLRDARLIWDRSHVVRLGLDDGRTAVLKRRREIGDVDAIVRGFGAEVAALEFLSGMPLAVAPRLLGASDDLVVMEDLGSGGSVAHALLGADRSAAESALIAYARAMASVHAWSLGRAAEFARMRERRAPGVPVTPHWAEFQVPGTAGLLRAGSELGLGALASAAEPEIDSLTGFVNGVNEDYAGLLHSDACPDNTHLSGGRCRFFDYEVAGWGPVALDAVYLLAPFPSCWCFAPLPPDVASAALAAYRAALAADNIPVTVEFDAQLARALGFFVVARARHLPELVASSGPETEPDRNWGTTTLRPRLLTWLRSFTGFPASADALPRLHALAVALESALADRWGPVGIPSYPALARPGDLVPKVPAAWLEA